MSFKKTVTTRQYDLSHAGREPGSDFTTTCRTEWWRIGGPNTILPRPIESFLCWSLALSCLSVSGYHYIVENYMKPYSICFIQEYLYLHRRRIATDVSTSTTTDRTSTTDSVLTTLTQQFPCWLPLMTYSRAEVQRGTPYDRYKQLIRLLEIINPSYITKQCDLLLCNSIDSTNINNCIISDATCHISDTELIQLIRQNEIVRRLVSLALRPMNDSISSSSNNDMKNKVWQLPFGQQLIRIWSHLLVLPPIQSYDSRRLTDQTTTEGIIKTKCMMIIALIIPCYKERTYDIVKTINGALQNCHQPQQVHVILVMAGKDASIDRQNLLTALLEADKDNAISSSTFQQVSPTSSNSSGIIKGNSGCQRQWGEFQIVEFSEESGRGPCLNYGAAHAHRYNNHILTYTFCHSDTLLPYLWDTTLLQTLYPSERNDVTFQSPRINACAYPFAIDTSRLRQQQHDANNHSYTTYYPPGIHAIEMTANLRCQLWSLPYGDQCISIRKDDFHYLGGFPHQCLMEDYEMISLLRQRTKLLPQFRDKYTTTTTTGTTHSKDWFDDEVLEILSGPPVLCSPRRWQKFGVFYVTYTNSRLVNLYNNNKKERNGITPDDIYRLYYGHALDVVAPKSPWELTLEQILTTMNDK